MSTSLTTNLSTAALTVFLLGCGNGGRKGEPEGPVAITPSAEINGFLDSVCTFVVRAGGAPNKLTCAQGLMANDGRMMIDLASAIKTGTVIYHRDVAEQCAAEALTLPCTQTAYKTLSADCVLAFEATVVLGGTCHIDYECLTGTSCSGRCDAWDLANCCTGTCAPTSSTAKPTTTVGAGDGEACAAGTTCENVTSYCEPTSGTCQARLTVGAKCSSDSSCMADAICTGGTCRVRPSLGENCKLAGGGYAQCLVGGCDQNDVCAATNFVVQCF